MKIIFNKEKLILLFIFICAFVLRIYKINDYPSGFTPDEAAQGYTAYSILKTGKDEWGIKYPLNPRSFGDFKPPLYTYLVIPSIAIFGLNELTVRLPNALLGSLAVLVTYFLSKEMFKKETKEKDYYFQYLPFVAALFLTISPWHISLSRGAFEANLTTFFLPAGALFFLYSLKKPLLFPLSSLLFSLNLFSYHSAKIITPLILLLLFFLQRKEIKKQFAKYKLIFTVSLLIFASGLYLCFWGILHGGGTRATDIGIFSGSWQGVANQRFFAYKLGLPDFISRIFNNKFTFLWNEFTRNYFSYLSLHFLFTQGAGEATYGMIPGRGMLYLIELPLFFSAFYFLFQRKSFSLLFLWLWIFLSPVPAALSRGVGYHANRVAIMMPAIQIISAYGLVILSDLICKKYGLKRSFLFIFLFFFLLAVSFCFFLEDYFFQGPRINAPKMSYGWRQVINYINGEQNVEKIIISKNLSEPQAFVMFYGKINPSLVQSQTKPWLEYQKYGHFVDQLSRYYLDKYEFRNFIFPEDYQEKFILVGTDKDFWGQERVLQEKMSRGEIKEEKIINFPDGTLAFRIIKL